MRYLMMIGIVAAMCGCGPREPSLSEVERGMKESFIRQTGNFAVRLTSHARKISDGRWSVWLTVEQNGSRRTLHATAVMDKNGDLHYYVD